MTTKEHRANVGKEAINWWAEQGLISQEQFKEEYFSSYLRYLEDRDLPIELKASHIVMIYLHEIYALIQNEND
jgi:hypothetical protein